MGFPNRTRVKYYADYMHNETHINKYSVAVVGPMSIISGFKALGGRAFDAQSGAEALKVIAEIKQRADTAVIILTEDIASDIPEDEYDKITSDPLPAVVVLPGVGGSTGRGSEKLKRLAERAIGSSII